MVMKKRCIFLFCFIFILLSSVSVLAANNMYYRGLTVSTSDTRTIPLTSFSSPQPPTHFQAYSLDSADSALFDVDEDGIPDGIFRNGDFGMVIKGGNNQILYRAPTLDEHRGATIWKRGGGLVVDTPKGFIFIKTAPSGGNPPIVYGGRHIVGDVVTVRQGTNGPNGMNPGGRLFNIAPPIQGFTWILADRPLKLDYNDAMNFYAISRNAEKIVRVQVNTDSNGDLSAQVTGSLDSGSQILGNGFSIEDVYSRDGTQKATVLVSTKIVRLDDPNGLYVVADATTFNGLSVPNPDGGTNTWQFGFGSQHTDHASLAEDRTTNGDKESIVVYTREGHLAAAARLVLENDYTTFTYTPLWMSDAQFIAGTAGCPAGVEGHGLTDWIAGETQTQATQHGIVMIVGNYIRKIEDGAVVYTHPNQCFGSVEFLPMENNNGNMVDYIIADFTHIYQYDQTTASLIKIAPTTNTGHHIYQVYNYANGGSAPQIVRNTQPGHTGYVNQPTSNGVTGFTGIAHGSNNEATWPRRGGHGIEEDSQGLTWVLFVNPNSRAAGTAGLGNQYSHNRFFTGTATNFERTIAQSTVQQYWVNKRAGNNGLKLRQLLNMGPIIPGPTCQQGSSCYTGPPNTQGIGVCMAGTTQCSPTQICLGEILPGNEICDGVDNDCNGQIDENNVCGVPTSGTLVGTATINPSTVTFGQSATYTLTVPSSFVGAQYYTYWSPQSLTTPVLVGGNVQWSIPLLNMYLWKAGVIQSITMQHSDIPPLGITTVQTAIIDSTNTLHATPPTSITVAGGDSPVSPTLPQGSPEGLLFQPPQKPHEEAPDSGDITGRAVGVPNNKHSFFGTLQKTFKKFFRFSR